MDQCEMRTPRRPVILTFVRIGRREARRPRRGYLPGAGSAWLESYPRCKLQLTRCVVRSGAHAPRLHRFRTVRCTRVVIALHVEGIEGIQIHYEVYPLADWE